MLAGFLPEKFRRTIFVLGMLMVTLAGAMEQKDNEALIDPVQCAMNLESGIVNHGWSCHEEVAGTPVTTKNIPKLTTPIAFFRPLHLPGDCFRAFNLRSNFSPQISLGCALSKDHAQRPSRLRFSVSIKSHRWGENWLTNSFWAESGYSVDVVLSDFYFRFRQ